MVIVSWNNHGPYGRKCMKIQIVRSKKGNKNGWFWRIVASNGRTLCHSEIYTTLANARKTASRIRDTMVGVGIEEV